MRKCLNCGAPLPRDAHPLRKFCDNKGACKQQFHRRTHNPEIDAKSRIPPIETGNGTGDEELDGILFMRDVTGREVPATLRNTLLKELLDKRREEGRREVLAATEKWKEERVLNDEQAKAVARFLASKYYAS